MNREIFAILTFFVALTVINEGHAQLTLEPLEVQPIFEQRVGSFQQQPAFLATELYGYNSVYFSKRQAAQSSSPFDPTQVQAYRTSAFHLPDMYQYEDLAFFCKWEVKLEKAAQMPVKFRLGDVQYVDWLEGKRPDY